MIEATDFAGMPVQSMRDLTELKLFSVDGATWAWISGMLFMPAELAKPLVNGERKTVIGDKGYSEWLQLKQDAILSFAKPDDARIMVFTANGAVLHDSALTRGAVFAPAGSWLEMAGNVGDSFSVTVRGTP